ncbi:MAG: hypothetical protein ACR2MZ_05055 [Candidatus Dormibacter sp.]
MIYVDRPLEPVKDFVDTIDAHWDDVVRWFQKTRTRWWSARRCRHR